MHIHMFMFIFVYMCVHMCSYVLVCSAGGADEAFA